MLCRTITFLLLLTVPPARAQEKMTPPRDTINTDRPDQSEAPYVMKPGQFQAESGVLINSFRESETALIGMLTLRYGVFKRLELRAVAEDGRNRDYFLENTTQGLYSLAIGAKISIIEKQRGLIPEVSLLGWYKLPYTARADSQSKVYAPSVILATEHKFGQAWELEFNAGYKQDGNDYGHEWMSSASLHYALTARLKIFAEYFGHYIPEEELVHNADAGVMYLLNRNLQVDFAAGSSVSAVREKQNMFGSLGLALRVE